MARLGLHSLYAQRVQRALPHQGRTDTARGLSPLRPIGDDNIPRPDVTKYPTPALSPKPVVSGHVGANDGIQNVLHRLELRSTADGDHGFAQPPQRGIGRERWPQARQVAPEVARKLSQSFPSLGKPSLLVLEDAG